MGTNFYMITTEKKNHLGDKQRLTDVPEFGYSIHIAKTSAGWKPVFEAHEQIRSVDDLWAVYKKDNCKIYDEYDRPYDFNEFNERVVKFNPKGQAHNESSYYFESTEGHDFLTTEFE